MQDKMIFWTWRTDAVRELLTWMRDYNVGIASDERIHFYGVETQDSRYTADILVDRIRPYSDALADSIRQ